MKVHLIIRMKEKSFGKKINKFQAVSFKLADMATQIEASKLLVYNVSMV